VRKEYVHGSAGRYAWGVNLHATAVIMNMCTVLDTFFSLLTQMLR